MKSNKKRKDARFPKWILDALFSIQIKYEWNFTEALLRCAEKGINYYEKQWQKMYGKKASEAEAIDDRCPNESQVNNTIVTDEELDKLFAEIFEPTIKENKEKQLDEELDKMMEDLYGPKTNNVPKTKTDK